MTESAQRQQLVNRISADIFRLFAEYDAPLGDAGMATTMVLIYLARQAGVSEKELIRSVRVVWKNIESESSRKSN